MADDSILVETSDGIATVTFNRPERLNALTSEMMGQTIPNLWPTLQEDKEVKVVILTGAGDRAFSSGMDVKEAPVRRKRDIPRGMSSCKHGVPRP